MRSYHWSRARLRHLSLSSSEWAAGVGHHHTVEDIVLTVRTTQYQLHRHHCSTCQKDHLASLPANLGGAVRIGPRVLALAAWMRLDMRQSIGNIDRFALLKAVLYYPYLGF